MLEESHIAADVGSSSLLQTSVTTVVIIVRLND
jgi:hypothetical protein